MSFTWCASARLARERSRLPTRIVTSQDAKRPNDDNHLTKKQLTRWQEVMHRVNQLLELIAYLPSPPVEIRWLNRADVLRMQRQHGEPPPEFLRRAQAHFMSVMQRGPNGLTPFLQRARESLSRNHGLAVLRYWFGDGVPTGGEDSIEAIKKLVKTRNQPERNPIALMSCSDCDEDVEWLKELEECAPFVSELDDYRSEEKEVLHDQGAGFPFSYGMYCVSSLVGALCPHDLDALDEGAPLTWPTVNDLLGYEISAAEYDHYWNNFLHAQRQQRRTGTTVDKIKAEFVNEWPKHKADFQRAAVAADIPIVATYRKKLAAATSSSCVVM